MSKHNYNQYSKKPNQNPQQKKPDVTATAKPVVSTKTIEMPEIKSAVPEAPTVHNYTVQAESPKPAAPEVKMVEETVKTVSLPETVEGTVVNCAKLNVRVAPDITAEVVGVLDAMSEIEIDVAKSTNEWFHVCTAIGIEGYCMRKFIEAYL